MKKYLFMALFAMSASILASCATILGDTTEEITIDSSPQNATVFIDGKEAGKTPLTTQVSKSQDDKVITIRKEGYNTSRGSLDSEVGYTWLLNFFTGGLPGTTTDALSGAMYEYSPNSYHATLKPKREETASTRWPKHAAAEAFIIKNHAELGRDLQNRSGEHLNALLQKFNITASERAQYLDRLESAYMEAARPPEFARESVSLLSQD